MDPVVSVILTTTGERGSFAAALRSVLAQDFRALEVIVVDDARAGSVWPQAEPALADPRVRLVTWRQQSGPAAARNAGWAAARGEWICYLDDDNEYLPGKVRAQHELAVRTGAPVVLCGVEYDAGGRRRRKQLTNTEFRGDARLLQTLADTNLLFHRRDVQPRWEEDLRGAEDASLFQAILQAHRIEVVPNVPAALVLYRAHAGTRVNRNVWLHHRGLRRLLVHWTRGYSPEARRVLLCRQLLATNKHTSGGWLRLARHARALVRTGGWGEWRAIANVIGTKLPLVRRWMIS